MLQVERLGVKDGESGEWWEKVESDWFVWQEDQVEGNCKITIVNFWIYEQSSKQTYWFDR